MRSVFRIDLSPIPKRAAICLAFALSALPAAANAQQAATEALASPVSSALETPLDADANGSAAANATAAADDTNTNTGTNATQLPGTSADTASMND